MRKDGTSGPDQLAGTSLNPEEPTSHLPLPGDRRHWSFATEW